jgi:hypothetical protein
MGRSQQGERRPSGLGHNFIQQNEQERLLIQASVTRLTGIYSGKARWKPLVARDELGTRA